MKILIKRTYLKDDCTVGFLFVDGKYLCDTLEPHAICWADDPDKGQHAQKRVAGETAIPEGTYILKLKGSKTHKRVMPTLPGVPQFGTVVLRPGTKTGKTRGDILVGHLSTTGEGHPSDHPRLINSLYTFQRLFKRIAKAVSAEDPVWVTIISPHRWRYPFNLEERLSQAREAVQRGRGRSPHAPDLPEGLGEDWEPNVK